MHKVQGSRLTGCHAWTPYQLAWQDTTVPALKQLTCWRFQLWGIAKAHCLTWPVLGEPAQAWGGSTLSRWSGRGCPWGARLVDGGGALAPLAEQVLCLGDDSEQTPEGVEQHLQQQPHSEGVAMQWGTADSGC